MHFALALAIAASFWSSRDTPVPCHPVQVRFSYEQMGALDGFAADVPAGVQALARAVATQAQANTVRHATGVPVPACSILTDPVLRDELAPDMNVGGNRADYCATIVHEAGHIALTAAGVPADRQHNVGGVMSAEAGSGHVPWACEHPRRWRQRHHR